MKMRGLRNGRRVEFVAEDLGERHPGIYVSRFIIEGRRMRSAYSGANAEMRFACDAAALAHEGFDVASLEIFSQGQWMEVAAPRASCAPAQELPSQDDPKRGVSWHFWKFVHNTLIHPWLGLPFEIPGLNWLHDWTGKRCEGGG